MDTGGEKRLKGLSEFIRPYIATPGRLRLRDIVEEAINSKKIDEENDDFRHKVYSSDVSSLLNQADFYSVGDDVFVHIDCMTEDERARKAASAEKTAEIYANKAKTFRGQMYMEIGRAHV